MAFAKLWNKNAEWDKFLIRFKIMIRCSLLDTVFPSSGKRPPVWILPLIALIIGGWLIVKSIREDQHFVLHKEMDGKWLEWLEWNSDIVIDLEEKEIQ